MVKKAFEKTFLDFKNKLNQTKIKNDSMLQNEFKDNKEKSQASKNIN